MPMMRLSYESESESSSVPKLKTTEKIGRLMHANFWPHNIHTVFFTFRASRRVKVAGFVLGLSQFSILP
jgi:hypothetical protein